MADEAIPVARAASESAASVISRRLLHLMDPSDLAAIHASQLDAIENLRSSNARLSDFNDSSEKMYQQVAGDFMKSTKILTQAQADLMDIFKRIRTLRNRIKKAYPEACPESFDDDLTMDEKEEKERLRLEREALESSGITASGNEQTLAAEEGSGSEEETEGSQESGGGDEDVDSGVDKQS